MEMLLTRTYAIDDATIGTLELDGVFECFTLEDTVRAKKIYSKTAIPAGRYMVKLTYSPAFSQSYDLLGRGCDVPEVLNVPNFSGIHIHVGNTAADSAGCILVGSWKGGKEARISGSDIAYKALRKKLVAAKGVITITIKDITVPLSGSPCMPTTFFQGVFGRAALGLDSFPIR